MHKAEQFLKTVVSELHSRVLFAQRCVLPTGQEGCTAIKGSSDGLAISTPRIALIGSLRFNANYWGLAAAAAIDHRTLLIVVCKYTDI